MEEKATIKISKELASQLKKLMDVGDTYESVGCCWNATKSNSHENSEGSPVRA